MSESHRLMGGSTRNNGRQGNWHNNAGLPGKRRQALDGKRPCVLTEEGHVTLTEYQRLEMPVGWWGHGKPPSWCLTLQQATLLAGLSSTIFSLLIFVHEVVIEGGFDARNYVVIAFCVIWLIVTAMLFLAVHKAANFMLLPWLVLTCVLTPLFMVGIVAGGKVIGLCLHNHIQEACNHEMHIFGTLNHFVASVKLGILIFMTITNCVFLFIVYRYFCVMNKKTQPTCQTIWLKSTTPETKPLRYHRIRDAGEPDSQEPLFQSVQDNKLVT